MLEQICKRFRQELFDKYTTFIQFIPNKAS